MKLYEALWSSFMKLIVSSWQMIWSYSSKQVSLDLIKVMSQKALKFNKWKADWTFLHATIICHVFISNVNLHLTIVALLNWLFLLHSTSKNQHMCILPLAARKQFFPRLCHSDFWPLILGGSLEQRPALHFIFDCLLCWALECSQVILYLVVLY